MEKCPMCGKDTPNVPENADYNKKLCYQCYMEKIQYQSFYHE